MSDHPPFPIISDSSAGPAPAWVKRVRALGLVLAAVAVVTVVVREAFRAHIVWEREVLRFRTGYYTFLDNLSVAHIIILVLAAGVALIFLRPDLTSRRQHSVAALRAINIGGIASAFFLMAAFLSTGVIFRDRPIALALLLLALLVWFVVFDRRQLPRRGFLRLGAWLEQPRSGRYIDLALFGAAAGLALWSCFALLDGRIVMADSLSQIMQARCLLNGYFAFPLPAELVSAACFPMAGDGARLYSQFPPGHILLLLPSILLGFPQLTNMLLGAGAVVLVRRLAEWVGGRTVSLAAALLFLLSPWSRAMNMEAMNHVSTLFCLTGAALCLLPDRRSAAWWGALGGLLLGWAAITRPLTAAAHGIVIAVWIAFQWRGAFDLAARVRWTRKALAGVAALAPPLLLLLWYNHQTTGSAWLMGYAAVNPGLRLGFIADSYLKYRPLDAFENFSASVISLNWVLFGWPIGSLWLFLLWWLRSRFTARECVLAGIAAAQFVIYVFYRHHDLMLSARFYYEALGALSILAALGLLALWRGEPSQKLLLVIVALCFSCYGFFYKGSYWGSKLKLYKLHSQCVQLNVDAVDLEAQDTVFFLPRDLYMHAGSFRFPFKGPRKLLFFKEGDKAEVLRHPYFAADSWRFVELDMSYMIELGRKQVRPGRH